MPRWLIALVVLTTLWPAAALSARSAADTMAICRNAAIAAADKHGVPRKVLVAITLVETRTKREGTSGPWPWTVNVAGKGAWFDSRAAALLHAQRALARGQPSFDVGCFQLNYRWHGQHFASIDQMFEPGPSGDYAARFLKSLHAETGDWIKASGLYHSRTSRHAKRYRGLVAKTVKRMGGEVPQMSAVAATDTAPTAPRDRVFRVSPEGALIPIRSRMRVRTPNTSGLAGSLGTSGLRRSRGPLIVAGPHPGGG